MLTQEILKQKVSYEPSTGVFTSKHTGKTYNSIHPKGYIQISVCNKPYLAHRLAWLYVYGVWPEPQIDHINRIKIDNRISNLHVVDCRTNILNRGVQTNNKTGYTGVEPSKNGKKDRFIAKHKYNGVVTQIGTYDTAEEANEARLVHIASLE